MNQRRIPLLVGLALALGTGILLLNYLTQLQRPVAGTRSVVIALTDIPARAQVKPENVTVTTREATQVDPDAISDAQNALGKIALITIPAGSVLTASKIGTAPELGLPARLAHGLRAVSIAVDRVKDVSGLVQPGDRVDVLASVARTDTSPPRVFTILRSILVLSIGTPNGTSTETASATPPPANDEATTVALALTPQQANLLVLADSNATLRLALRSPEERARSFPTDPLVLGGSEVAHAPPGPAPEVAALPAVPDPVTVTRDAPPVAARVRSKWAAMSVPILDGDHFVGNTQR
jgi:pilus assembly protein CpaB